jgi:hypothetical protein
VPRAGTLPIVKTRLAAAVILAALAVTLVGCEPYFVPTDPTQARISISIGSTGGADCQLVVGGRTQSKDQLVRIGQSVATSLFPTAARRSVGIGSNPGGFPLVHIHASGVYEPSAHPVVHLDTGAAVAVLNAMGATDVDIEIRGPGVPAVANWRSSTPTDSTDDIYTWQDVGPHDTAPAGTLALNPRPWRGAEDLTLAALCLASLYPAIWGLRRKRRLLSIAAAVVASVTAGIEIFSAGAVQPDNLGVAGLLNGLELNVVRIVDLSTLLVAPAVILMFIVTVAGARTPNVFVASFNPPPGWPPPPAGWVPPPGWQPDPPWRLPPSGWVFWSPTRVPPRPTAPPSG